MQKCVLGVLASGRGTGFQSIVDHIRLGVLRNVKVGVLICNNPDAYVLKRAEQCGVDSCFLDHRGRGREEYDRDLVKQLDGYGVGLVALAGWMRILTSQFVNHFRWRCMNIHPSLLPSFPGLNAQRQAVEYGVKVSGCTVHYLDVGVDVGPIILQHAVPLLEGDDEKKVSERIQVYEHRVYPKAIQLHVDGRIKIEGRVVKIDYGGGWEKSWDERQKTYVEFQMKQLKREGVTMEGVV